jgi:hypothetical protein
MKNICRISVLLFLWLLTGSMILAQEDNKEYPKTIEKEVKVIINDDEGDPHYTVETVTTEDGKQKVTTKSYGSLEEMKADSTIEILSVPDGNDNYTVKVEDKGSGVMVYSNEKGEKINIKVDEITDDMEWIEESEDDGHKVIKSQGGKMMIFRDGEDDFEGNDSNKVVKRYEVKVIKDEDGTEHKIQEHKEVFVFNDDEGNITIHEGSPEDVKVWVDKDGNRSIKRSFSRTTGKTSIFRASIESIGTNDEEFSAFNLTTMPKLVLKSLNYYPNPNEGQFTLTFSGARRPVIIRILDNKGNVKLEENVPDFKGSFNEIINVKSFDKGHYLLQIFQQEKVLNRKLIVE